MPGAGRIHQPRGGWSGVACVVAGALLSGQVAPGHAQPAARVNISLISLSPTAVMTSWIALDHGFYRKHGLQVNQVFIEGATRGIQALVAGEVQITETVGPPVVNAHLAGLSPVLIAGLVNTLPYYLMARPEIRSPADLRGRTGANHMPGTSADFTMRIALRRFGLDPERDVTLRVIGGGPSRVAALRAGGADFTVGTPPEMLAMRKAGMEMLLDLAELKIPYQHTAAATTPAYLRSHREVVQRYVRALADSIRFFKAQREATIAVMARRARLKDPEILAGSHDWFKVHLADIPYPTVRGMETIITELARTKPDARRLRAADMVDEGVVRSLEAEGYFRSGR